MPQIEVSFDIDANGILNVHAKDKATGKEQSIVIRASSGLSDEEVEGMVQDAEANAEEDKKFQKLAAARNQADALVHSTKKSLSELGDKVPADQKEPIEKAITELEEVIKADNADEIEAKTKALSDVAGKMSEMMYQQQAQQEGAEQPADAAAADSADSKDSADTVDAEFEEVSDKETEKAEDKAESDKSKSKKKK